MNEDIEKVADKELVRRAGETVIGTPSGLKAQHAQAELTRRLIKSIRELNKTTSCYSKILIGLTVMLGILAVIQLIPFIKSIKL